MFKLSGYTPTISVEMLAPIKNIKCQVLKEAVICHKIAALSYLLAEALDELNPEVADSNPFKSNVMPWLISAMKLSVMSLEYKK
jgi:hypothetical protein